jgi:aspartate racemase
MSKTAKTVGILGGMGPYATLAFFQTVLQFTPAKKDWDHLRIIIDNNPHIPSRTRHFLLGEDSPLPGMLDSCRRLQNYPVDFIAIPCNSAAVFVPDLRRQLAIPILHICEIAAEALAEKHPSVRRVAALGAYTTYQQQTYASFLARHGIELIDHGAEVQQQIQQSIERLKLGETGSSPANALQQLIVSLQEKLRLDAVITACTEFACLPDLVTSIPVIDSSRELARHVVRLARA